MSWLTLSTAYVSRVIPLKLLQPSVGTPGGAVIAVWDSESWGMFLKPESDLWLLSVDHGDIKELTASKTPKTGWRTGRQEATIATPTLRNSQNMRTLTIPTFFSKTSTFLRECRQNKPMSSYEASPPTVVFWTTYWERVSLFPMQRATEKLTWWA